MSTIFERVGARYDLISDYFKCNALGRRPGDLTVLSLLPPVDRCLILERVLECGQCDLLTCVDKLSMAYYKAGWRDLAFAFIEKGNAAGWLSGHYGLFVEKLTDLPVFNVTRTYEEALRKLEAYDTKSAFCRLIRVLCTRYRGEEILTGQETPDELAAFLSERRAFIDNMTRDRAREFLHPSRDDIEAGKAALLANVYGVAGSYMLGGARPVDPLFAASDTLATMNETVRKVWEETEFLVRMLAPHPYEARRKAGERAFLFSVEFPAFCDETYQYRTSRQQISVVDAVDLMFEVMDVKPHIVRGRRACGERTVRFSWMFLQGDVERLLARFPSVVFRPGEVCPMEEVFCDMNAILRRIAEKSVDVYPFMECEFVGW